MAKPDVEFKEAIEELADAVVEELKEGYRSDLEPFEAYAQRMRQELHTNMEDFHDRFLKGYEVLIHELLERQEKSHEDEGEVPPGAIKL